MKFNRINLPCLFITFIVAINLFNLCEMRNKSSMRPPKVIPTALPGRVCAKNNILLAKCTPGHECKRIDLGFKSKSQISKCVQSRRPTGYRPAKQTFAMLGQKCAEHNAYFKPLKCGPGLECRQKSVLKNGRLYTNSSAASYCQKQKSIPQIHSFPKTVGGDSWKQNPNLKRKEIPQIHSFPKTVGGDSWKQNPNLKRKEIPQIHSFPKTVGGDSWKQNPNLNINKEALQPIGKDSWRQNPNLHINRKRATGLIDLSAKKGEICHKPARSAGQIVMAPKRCEHGYVCRQSDEDELMRLPTPSFCLKPKKRATGLLMPVKELELPALNLDSLTELKH